VIAFEEVAARRAPLALARVSLAWGPGVHAVVGGASDGGLLLLALVAGRARPRSGRVLVLEGAPTDAGVRTQVAHVPLRPALPAMMRVSEVLATAAAIRGDGARDARDRLGVLGVEGLAARRVETLSPDEARAVALAEAVTSPRVRVLVVEEPLVAIDPRALARVPEVLRALSREPPEGPEGSGGRAVVVATASVRDAAEIADDHVVLRQGVLVARAGSSDALARFAPHGARLRILTSDPRALAAALANEDGVEAVGRRGPCVTARGRDPVDLARAAGRAILVSGVDVTEVRSQPPSLEEAQAAVAPATGDPAP
jgi:ABC-2 type transport system ATP-binding protein